MLDRDIAEAARIAREAGAILMAVYRTDFSVAYKTEADPVTEADTRANAYIVAELEKAFPGDGVVAEETEDQSAALRGGRCWYVDPLDGTKEFVARNGEFSVMLGLAIDGVSAAGVVYQPVNDKLYTGVVGEAAFLEREGERYKLEVSRVSEPSQLKLVVSRSHRNRAVNAVVKRLGIRRETTSGSVGLKAGLIAEQQADVYLHISDKSSMWDACGPEAVLKAAGGRFTDLNGQPYRYGGTDMRNRRGILACNAAAFDCVLPVARDAARAVGLID
ncbi:MAG TPA: 3'(2'),5'-bisphosphate nucleotidase CysQ [Polyangiales bacterium]|jgi:3'(2'), 5'-bisphosphate nucleotidase|nr:3'(2'),5'-bisphosphate nucleotidase CysQ [Polyangiales bacterium]